MKRVWKKAMGGALAAALTLGIMPAPAQAEETGAQTDLPAPVLYASFDNGNAEDSSGNGNNGTVIGTPEFVDGVSGKAVHIVNSEDIAGSGADAEQYVDFGTPEDLQFGTGDFSIAFWYRSDRSSDNHKEGSIVSNKDWASGSNQGLNFGDMWQGINMNYRAGGDGRKETDRYSEITDGEWHFITGTFDRDGYMTLYIDGELPTEGNGYQAGSAQVSISDQSSTIDAYNFTVGADGRGKYGLLNGYIDELSVYKEVLTQEQVKELGKTDSTGDDTDRDAPVLDVTFDDSTAADSVAGNNGTITGDVEFVDGVSGKAVRISNPEDIAGQNTTAEQYIDFGTPEALQFGTDDFTIMFWYQSDGTLSGEGAVVSNKDWSTGGNPGFTIGDMRQGMTLNFRAQGSSGRLDTSRYGGATEAGVWHHIAAVFNRTGNMTLYVDGAAAVSQSINSQAGLSIDVMNFVIGADGNHQCGVQDSYIDELKVYKKALTADDIADYTAPFVLQNKLDEYEALIASSSASAEKKEAFRAAIDDIRARAEGVTDLDTIRALEDELKAAYNAFTGPEDGIMSFEVISDAHISGTNNSASPNQKLIDAMDDIANDYSGISALLNCGDYSNYASVSETQGYFNIIAPYKNDFEILTAMGNHDVRWLSGGWEEAEGRYLEYNQEYMGDVPDGQSYYDKWIDGYHFIVLNTQWDTKDRAYLSPEELDWFEEKLAENASPDKPIFVVLHQPLYDTYTNSNAWPAGVQDHQIKEILRNYPQTVMFNGHIHDGLGAIEVKQTDYGIMVDVPGMNSNDYGDGRGQLGFHVTVYDGKVRLDLRDYANDEWVSEYTYEFEINADAYPEGKIADISFDDETASDSTGNGNDGTIHGDVSFVEGVNGGKAVHISNENTENAEQYIEIGENLTLGEDDFTLMFWYKAAPESSAAGTILANSSASDTAGVVIDADGQNGLGLTAQAGGNTVSTGRTALSDGKWHAVSAVFDRDAKMTLYIDGAKAEEQDISAWNGSTLDGSALKFMIGADTDGGNAVTDLYIDDLKIYGNAVSANEISTTWTPYEITADQDSITVSWPLPTSSVEPAYLLLNGEKVTDIASGDTESTITGLEPGITYTVTLVNHEKSNARNLRDAYGFRVTTQADKTSLEELYNANKDKDVSGYTDSSAAAWKEALSAAENVLNDPSASTEDVQNAFDQLNTALNGLKLKADTEELTALVNTARELLSSDTIDQYTEESVQTLRDALAEAEKLLAQELSEDQQSLIDEAAGALQTAADSLEEIDNGGNEPENPDDGNKPGNPDDGNNPEDPDNGNKPGNPDDSTSGGSGNKPADPGQNTSGADQNIPQTGDSSAVWLWTAWILTALAAVLIAVKNKKTAE